MSTGNRYSEEIWQQIYHDHINNGMSYNALSAKYGVSKGAISPRIRKMKGPQGERKPSNKIYKKPIGPRYKLVGKKYILSRMAVSPITGCWEWTGTPTSAGYGQLRMDKVYWTAHRYSYTCFVGPIPENLIIRHMCHNPICCNPEHLEVGTFKDNYQDSIEKHTARSRKRRKRVNIDNICYESVRIAHKRTGISYAHLAEFVDSEGYFNREAYDRVEILDSNDNLKLGSTINRKSVSIQGIDYSSILSASQDTGITRRTIAKHINKHGFFNIKDYRDACKTNNKTPKI